MKRSLSDIYAAHLARNGFAADPEQVHVLAALDRIKTDLERAGSTDKAFGRLRRAPPPPRGAYVWGEVGRGKSMLMKIFFDAVDIERKRRVHFHGFMHDIHQQLHRARQSGTSDPLIAAADQVLGQVRLLALDEMEITEIADAMIVGRIFEHMVRTGVVLVITSNRAPNDLYRDSLGREAFRPFVRLIEQTQDICHLRGDTDYRRSGTAVPGSYHTPLDAKTRAAMEETWQRLGGDAETVTIGRKSHATRLRSNGAGALRAGFADLCARPHGAVEYLQLAGMCRTLLLEDIPRMTPRQHNEARRFVLLIDILYEAGTALAVSAEDLPENLYADPDGAGVFAFERAISRLCEMNDPGWRGIATRPDRALSGVHAGSGEPGS